MKEKIKSHWFILVILAFAQFMVVLDSSVVNVALPHIQKTFDLSTSNLQWIITAYTLTFGGFLLFGGRAADLYGRKKIFLIGVIFFGLMSLIDGFSRSGGMLIGSRILQGLGAAFMSPAALSIVLTKYREGHSRNIALSVWGAVASGGAAAGVLLGGILTQYYGWRWNFFINVPISILIFVIAYKIVPSHDAEESNNAIDLAGAISVTISMLSLVYGLTQGPTYGWFSWSTLPFFGITIVSLIFFYFNETRQKHPLLPLNIFKNKNLTGANLTIFPVVASVYALFFFLSLYIQNVLGYSPVKTGLSFLIVPLTIMLAATQIPKIIKILGSKYVLIGGIVLIAIALIYLTKLPLHSNYWTNILPALIILGLGAGTSFVSGTIIATSGVEEHKSGLASGILNTSQQIGGSVGLAILTGVTSSYVLKINQHLPKNISPKLIPIYVAVHSYRAAFTAGVIIALIGIVLAFILIENTKPKKLL